MWKNKIGGWALSLLLCLLVAACSDDEGTNGVSQQSTTYKVAVVVPAADKAVCSRTVDWALNNIRQAQQGLTTQVDIEVEWHDEDASDLESYLQKVAQDTTYAAVIGPLGSAHARIAVSALDDVKKTLILPITTSTELQRLFAGKGYVWNLTQSDMTQSEILLTQAQVMENFSVMLLTSDGDYSSSFKDWFAYQATELGMTAREIFIYHTESELREMVQQLGSGSYSASLLIFAPEDEADAVVFDEEYGKLAAANPRLRFPDVLCSDKVNSSKLASQLTHREYDGISPCADPLSGFDKTYELKFGIEPTAGEAHLFDAVTMLAYALTSKKQGESLNDALLRVLDGNDDTYHSWLPHDMHQVFSALQTGTSVSLSGVTGDWTFDSRNHISVLNTIYSHWILRDGKYTTMEYLSTDGGSRTTSTLQAWDVQSQYMQEFNKNQEDRTYGALEGQWAVVIGTSDTWANYRHQADALAMYQLLKRHGYPDDHIILIIEDNLAYDSHNLYPGVIRVRPDGENVYVDVDVDYHISDITIDDLKQIMLGQASDRLPQVIQPTAHDNVIVFWCGHGNYDKLAWGSDHVIYGSDVREILDAMNEAGNYRKILFSMDACYSGSIGEACTGVPGALFISAANANESSKADMKDSEMGIWLSNGFTRAFQETIDATPAISIRDLYYQLARYTTGSHATIYNMENYGNLFTSSMEEFVSYK
jgi:ABC-type branched-subunit amino acid transport system substrate-binding protein